MVNIIQKGAEAERQICTMLNGIIWQVMKDMNYPPFQMINYTKQVQRNQNQSAVGGCDLVGTFEFAIEIKRQERESIGVWWQQCCASARAINKVPVLLWRKNNTKWKCMMLAPLTAFSESIRKDCANINCPVQLPIETFQLIFREVAIAHFRNVPILLE